MLNMTVELHTAQSQPMMNSCSRNGTRQIYISEASNILLYSASLSICIPYNGHLLRQSLPQNLTRPTANCTPEERIEMHKQISIRLQASGPARRAEIQARAKSTRQRNRAAKGAGAHGHGQTGIHGANKGQPGKGTGQGAQHANHSVHDADAGFEIDFNGSDDDMVVSS